jgi:predicted metalloprotease with PDZ domain
MDFYPAYISYVGEDYGILDSHGLFLSPLDFYVNGKIRVQMSLPEGWKVITPWEEESPFSFSAKYIQDVTDSVFCIGKFQAIKRNIGEKEVYAVHCGSKDIGSELERKADTVAIIFKDYISRFGDFPFKKYIAIFAERTADGKYVHGSAHGVGFAGPIDMPLAFTNQFIAHEIFHVWNGRVINQKSQYEVWFKEGFTQYYGYLTPYRTGLYGEEQFIYYLRSDYQEYVNKYEAGEDIALARVNEGLARKEGHENAESIRNLVMYRKGALIASLVDDRIRESTGDKKNLDDLMRYMFVKFHDREYSSDDILKALNTITGQDFTSFFSDFIYGRTKLPLTKKTKPKA